MIRLLLMARYLSGGLENGYDGRVACLGSSFAFPAVEGGASQYRDGRVLLRRMHQHGLDVTEMPLKAEIGAEPGIADAAYGNLSGIPDLSASQQSGADQPVGVVQAAFQCTEDDLPRPETSRSISPDNATKRSVSAIGRPRLAGTRS